MKQILILAGVFLVGTALATLMLYDNGQVSMVWGGWMVETSLSFLLAMLIITFLVGYIVVRLALNIWYLPVFWGRRQKLRRYSKAESTMAKGMIALEYGDWQRAEKELIKSAKQSEAGLVHYLSAAKMAHNQKAYDRRDRYLEEARDAYPTDYATIGLVEARLLGEDQPELALTILETLHQQQPKQAVILSEYAAVLRQLGQWETLETLLPTIRRTNAFAKDQLVSIEVELWAGKLASAPDEATLERLWQNLNSKQRLMPEVLTEYVERRMGWGQQVGLAKWIESALKKQWSDRLVYQYGRISFGPSFERLKVAEKWLHSQPDNPVVLLSLGRLACSSQLWALGQGYLKKSLAIRPEIETFHALAQCYEAEGLESQAALTYKEAIMQLERKA